MRANHLGRNFKLSGLTGSWAGCVWACGTVGGFPREICGPFLRISKISSVNPTYSTVKTKGRTDKNHNLHDVSSRNVNVNHDFNWSTSTNPNSDPDPSPNSAAAVTCLKIKECEMNCREINCPVPCLQFKSVSVI